jgi:outer membrane receptor for ferrienterochelin and colicin
MALALPLAPAAATGEAKPAVEDLIDLPFQDALAVRIESAGKREEQIRDIPASVTLKTRDEIARYGWVSFEELLRSVPGFYVFSNTEDRFIGTRGAAFGGVQVLVNGIPQHPSLQKTLTGTEIAQLDIPVESIDGVEMIRGPMSVVYGNNAFQGVINVVSNHIG